MIEKLYTVEEVAELASVTGRTIRNYLKSGRLIGRKIGGQWRFPEAEVQRLLTGGEPALLQEDALPEAPQREEWEAPRLRTAPPPAHRYAPETDAPDAYVEDYEQGYAPDVTAPVQPPARPSSYYNEPAPLPGAARPQQKPALPGAAVGRAPSAPLLQQERTGQEPPRQAASLQGQPPQPVLREAASPPVAAGHLQPPAQPQPTYAPAAPYAPYETPPLLQQVQPPMQAPPQQAYGQLPYDASAQAQPVYASGTFGSPLPGPPPVPPGQPGSVYTLQGQSLGQGQPLEQGQFQQPLQQPLAQPLREPPSSYSQGSYPSTQQPFLLSSSGILYEAVPVSGYSYPPLPAGQAPQGYRPVQGYPAAAAPPPHTEPPETAPKVTPAAEPEPAPCPPKETEVVPHPQLSDVGNRVTKFISEVHDYSKGPQMCAVVDLHQSFSSARITSQRLGEIADEESEAGLLCQSFVEFDERFYVARYTLFGTTPFLLRCLKLIG